MTKQFENAAAEIVKKTSSLGTLLIKPVSKEFAREMIIEHHYSHKWNNGDFGAYNFGIYRTEDTDNCLGVAVYGYVKNKQGKMFTHPNPNAWLIELNRLWISDELGKNAETILISCSIKLLRKLNPNIVAVQSFADGRLGCGTIYKAANFQYYGFHYSKFLRHKKTGEIVHNQIFSYTYNLSGYLKRNLGFLLGEFEVFEVKTYRYIYPLCKHFKFKLKQKPYPEYEKGETPSEWVRDKKKIKENMIRLIEKIPI